MGLEALTLGISAGLGALGLGASGYANYKNWQQQEQANATMLDLAKNSATYKVQDLKNAGLNPILAAGQATQMPAIKAPSMDTDMVSHGLDGALKAQSIANTAAQNNLLNLQAEKLKAETLGQQIENKYAASLAENKIEGGIIQNTFNRLASPDRLKMLSEQLESMNLDQVNKQLDAKIKEQQIPLIQLQRTRTAMEIQLSGMKISETEKSILAKEVAIRLADQQLSWSQYQNDWFKSRGYVPGYNPSPINRGVDTLQGLFNSTYDWLKRGN